MQSPPDAMVPTTMELQAVFTAELDKFEVHERFEKDWMQAASFVVLSVVRP
jgi:hypothetical protein